MSHATRPSDGEDHASIFAPFSANALGGSKKYPATVTRHFPTADAAVAWVNWQMEHNSLALSGWVTNGPRDRTVYEARRHDR